jgi:hypothetical protein
VIGCSHHCESGLRRLLDEFERAAAAVGRGGMKVEIDPR